MHPPSDTSKGRHSDVVMNQINSESVTEFQSVSMYFLGTVFQLEGEISYHMVLFEI